VRRVNYSELLGSQLLGEATEGGGENTELDSIEGRKGNKPGQ